MPIDPASTRDRIYQAAVAEFSERGRDGTTIDRIARRAQANRERVYSYFGDKSALFECVVSNELSGIANSVPLKITKLSDVGAFAGNTFDYQQSHSHLARLVLWEGLVGSVTADDSPRKLLYEEKTAVVAAAQRRGLIDDLIEPGTLVFLLISLSSYWLAAPQLAQMLSADGPTSQALRRAAVVQAAERLATPRTEMP